MLELITTLGFKEGYQSVTIGKRYKAVLVEQYWTTILDDNNEEFDVPNWMLAK